jgi:UDP-N-acetylmuramoylalanine--D-glutamate ligase
MTNKIYKSALVLGLGTSGEAAARLLLAERTKVHVVDESVNEDILKRSAQLQALGAAVTTSCSALPRIQFDVCIVSPGIKPASPLLKNVLSCGLTLCPEFELGWSRARSPVIAISGSNGKSTLVKLCADALNMAGLSAFPAGNYGPPLSQVVWEQSDANWLVVEVSSFQLETARHFHPAVAVLLNVFPNHLDRHGDFASYIRLKAKLFANMSAGNTAIVNEQNLNEIYKLSGGKVALRSFGVSPGVDYCFRKNVVHSALTGKIASLESTIFCNEILGQTAAAAAAVLEACAVSLHYLENAAREFKPLPHRLEEIGTLNGVRFVDDSKATNVAALSAALTIMPVPIRLIAGGLPKNESYGVVNPLLTRKVRAAYLIGKAAGEMEDQWKGAVSCHLCETLEKAVSSAWRDARSGDTILLSPACASFDQFRNFEERGRKFRIFFGNL